MEKPEGSMEFEFFDNTYSFKATAVDHNRAISALIQIATDIMLDDKNTNENISQVFKDASSLDTIETERHDNANQEESK
ncbi:hypothetical protein N6G95_09755 [Pediococcus inopinatus]|uniref:hypothetical protein n=1 Tax=Pediococcus inopinatus TaxID=114090 RepID=UPI002B261ED7|nr:hypothetical protein [Pediococcus inopinatus]WPC19487.1 hypothetical protein N6G95_09755 [Pediococcus inopinatus]